MPSFSTLLAILEHTPRWVWVALVALLAAGTAQARPRHVTASRLVVLPSVLTVLSLLGLMAAFPGSAAPAGWTVGVVAAAMLGIALGAPAGARREAGGRRLALPGSWLPLALMLGLFATKFTVGVLVARSPALRQVDAFVGTTGLAYGIFSGVFLGRALALRTLLRPSGANAAAVPA